MNESESQGEDDDPVDDWADSDLQKLPKNEEDDRENDKTPKEK